MTLVLNPEKQRGTGVKCRGTGSVRLALELCLEKEEKKKTSRKRLEVKLTGMCWEAGNFVTGTKVQGKGI